MQMQSEPEPNSAFHAMPVEHRLWTLVAGVLLVLAFLFCLALPSLFVHSFAALYAGFVGALLAGTGVIVAARAVSRSSEQFAATEDGLVRQDRHGRITLLAWPGIGQVRVRPMLGRLDVSDATRSTTLRLPFALADYDTLALRIFAEAPPHALRGAGDRDMQGELPGRRAHAGAGIAGGSVHVFGGAPADAVFRARRTDAFALVVAPLVILLSIQLYGAVVILAWLVALGALLYWCEGWLRIRVESDALVIVRPLGSSRVPFDEVAHATLLADETRMRARPLLLIQRTNGTVLEIDGVREGEGALHAAIDEAQRARGHGSPRAGRGSDARNALESPS